MRRLTFFFFRGSPILNRTKLRITPNVSTGTELCFTLNIFYHCSKSVIPIERYSHMFSYVIMHIYYIIDFKFTMNYYVYTRHVLYYILITMQYILM